MKSWMNNILKSLNLIKLYLSIMPVYCVDMMECIFIKNMLYKDIVEIKIVINLKIYI